MNSSPINIAVTDNIPKDVQLPVDKKISFKSDSENFSEETDDAPKPKKQANVMWSKEEDDLLTTAVSIHGNKWDTIYSEYPQFSGWNRSKMAVCGHWKHLLKKTKLSDGRKAKEEKAKEEEKLDEEQNIIEVESELDVKEEEESFTIEVPKVKAKKIFWTEEQINLLKKAVVKEGTVWSQIMIKYPQFEKWGRTRKSIGAYWENMQKKDAKAEIKKEKFKNNVDKSDERFIELMKLSKEKLEELVKSYGLSIYVEGAGSRMFKPELVNVLLSNDVNFNIKDLHEELDEDENEDNYKTNVKFWNKINSENLGKQYYHRNFSEFCWTPKNNRHKITILSGHNQENRYITIPLYDKNNNQSRRYHHRFVYQAYHPEPTKCLGEDCTHKELDIFDVFSSSDQVDHIDGDCTNNKPENLQRLCLPCHAKKTNMQNYVKRSENISKSNSVPIIVYKKDDPAYKQIFKSIDETTKQLKISKSCIMNNIDKFEIDEIVWTRNGYRFEKQQELLEGEIFKDIPDFCGNKISTNVKNPQISNKGRIKTMNGRITYGQYREEGDDYFRANIYNFTSPVSVLVLKIWNYDGLIAKANQIKNSSKYPECKDMSVEDIINSNAKRYSIICDHIDRNKKNNNLENLRWLTMQENSENTDRVKIVQQFTKDGKFIKEFSSLTEAERQTGMNRNRITKVCKGELDFYGGFYWRFKPNRNEIIEI
jgi:hypothetical protein